MCNLRFSKVYTNTVITMRYWAFQYFISNLIFDIPDFVSQSLYSMFLMGIKNHLLIASGNFKHPRIGLKARFQIFNSQKCAYFELFIVLLTLYDK